MHIWFLSCAMLQWFPTWQAKSKTSLRVSKVTYWLLPLVSIVPPFWIPGGSWACALHLVTSVHTCVLLVPISSSSSVIYPCSRAYPLSPCRYYTHILCSWSGVPRPKSSKMYISISGRYPLGASSTTSSPPSKRNQQQLTLLNAPKGGEEGENKSPLWQRASEVNWTTANLQATPNSCVYLWDLVFMVAVK